MLAHSEAARIAYVLLFKSFPFHFSSFSQTTTLHLLCILYSSQVVMSSGLAYARAGCWHQWKASH